MEWDLVVALVAVLAGAGAGGWWWVRRQSASGSSRNDRYAAEAVISPAQASLYAYLQEAFPGQLVLFAQPLSRLVSVRHAENREHADQRLRDQWVDFVVCHADGKPAFAFQVDAYRTDETDAARREAALKHRVLSTAGVRLLRLKKSVRQLPGPQEFHDKLMGAAMGSSGDGRSEMGGLSGVRPEDMPVLTKEVRVGRGGHWETESMSFTDLMGLSQTQR